MEKISGIVPSSRRVSSVDLKSAPPVRPGTPTFGRPVGISTLAEAETAAKNELNKLSTADRAIARQKELADKRSLSEKGPELIQDMTDRFFMQKKKAAEPVQDFDLNMAWRPEAPAPAVQPPEYTLASGEVSEPMPEEAPVYLQPESVPEEERQYTPPGSYLDVTV